MKETNILEFKEEISKSFLKTVSAFSNADACACDRYYHAGTCGRDTGAWKYDFHDCTAGPGCGKSRTEVADRSSGQLSGTCPCGGGA